MRGTFVGIFQKQVLSLFHAGKGMAWLHALYAWQPKNGGIQLTLFPSWPCSALNALLRWQK